MSAQLLPNGRQQFVDQNGNPLVSGLVHFYVPNTTTPKDTWQDSGQTILNTNPIILDARGQATIFGSGDYRQVLQDAAANLIWDKVVSSPVTTGGLAANGPTGSGASLVGFDGTTLDQQFLSRANRVVDSISALRGISKAIYTRAFVTGYYAAGDGGGGEYWYDASDNTSADNGGTVIVAGDGARWKLTPQDTISVKQFGAKVDGVTDDSGSVQSAITAASSAGYDVFFPAGTCLCGSQLNVTHGTLLRGAGWDSILKLQANIGIAYSGGIYAQPLRDIKVLSTNASAILISVSGVDGGLRFDNVFFSGGSLGINLTSGVSTAGSYGIIGIGCIMSGQQIAFKLDPQTATFSQAHFVRGFAFFDYQQAINVNGGSGVFVEQCWFERDSVVTGAARHIYVTNCNKFVLRDSYIEEGGNAGQVMVYADAGADNISIKDNYITFVVNGQAFYNNSTADNIALEDNYITNTGAQTNMVDFGTANHVRAKGNTISQGSGTLTNAFTGSGDPTQMDIGPNSFGGTITNKYAGKLSDRPQALKAWAAFNANTVTTLAAYNCTITRQSTGNYTCTFDTAMPDANYAPLLSAYLSGTLVIVRPVSVTASAFTFDAQTVAGAYTNPTLITLMVAGV